MKQITNTAILVCISFSFIGCAYHTTRSYTYSNTSQPISHSCSATPQPALIAPSPFYRAVKYTNLRPDYPPYRNETPPIYFCY